MGEYFFSNSEFFVLGCFNSFSVERFIFNTFHRTVQKMEITAANPMDVNYVRMCSAAILKTQVVALNNVMWVKRINKPISVFFLTNSNKCFLAWHLWPLNEE